MIFGRAGEELDALRKAGIPYQIVPGITAALAAAADSATPVTLRQVSPGFLVATAHGAQSEELDHWASLATSGQTLGLYMGKTIAQETANKLILRGMSPSLPVGIVVNAGRKDRSFHRGTLADLAAGEFAMIEGPAIIFVGEAVAHGDWVGAAEIASQKYGVA
jgi:uroporphyrin-III C-methyltransferase/precorrin-2 dehydrogenase/sirohydrochlorin ferrochelatase